VRIRGQKSTTNRKEKNDGTTSSLPSDRLWFAAGRLAFRERPF
jgi:hypothetical protein